MKLNKILCLAPVLSLSQICYSMDGEHIAIGFLENNEIRLHCDNEVYLFDSISSFSQGVNNIFKGYFTFSSVYLNIEHNTVVFNIDYYNNTKPPYTLLLRGTPNFKPSILFDCGSTQVNFYKIIGNNINLLRFASDLKCHVRNVKGENPNNSLQKLIINQMNPGPGAFFGMGIPYSNFELSFFTSD